MCSLKCKIISTSVSEKEGCPLFEYRLLSNSSNIPLYAFFQYPRPGSNYNGLVYFIPGYGAHVQHLFDFGLDKLILSKGFAVSGLDMVGSGKSGGERGLMMKYSDILNDHRSYINYLKELKQENKNLFILGHSMGGLVSFLLSDLMKDSIKGCALLAPLFEMTPLKKYVKNMLGPIRHLAKYAPLFELPLKTNIEKIISKNSKYTPVIMADKLFYRKGLKLKSYLEIYNMIESLKIVVPKFTIPLILVHGNTDYLTCYNETKRVYDKIGSEYKKLVIMENEGHLLVLSNAKDIILKIIDNFFKNILKDNSNE